jgi:hypothetical protein
MEFAELIDLLIVQRWVATLRDPCDWGRWPLRSYVFGKEFLCSVRRRPAPVALERVAFVCAMVACDRAQDVSGGKSHMLLGDSSAERIVRTDGAEGWWSELESGGHGMRLCYWIHLNGLIEFYIIGERDDSMKDKCCLGHQKLGYMGDRRRAIGENYEQGDRYEQ